MPISINTCKAPEATLIAKNIEMYFMLGSEKHVTNLLESVLGRMPFLHNNRVSSVYHVLFDSHVKAASCNLKGEILFSSKRGNIVPQVTTLLFLYISTFCFCCSGLILSNLPHCLWGEQSIAPSSLGGYLPPEEIKERFDSNCITPVSSLILC